MSVQGCMDEQRTMNLIMICVLGFILLYGSPALSATDELIQSSPSSQGSEADKQPGEIQERAIRQGAGALGETSSCVCMRPLGQCVFSVQGGCVPHPGNPCNGGCIEQKNTSEVGGTGRKPGVASPPATLSR